MRGQEPEATRLNEPYRPEVRRADEVDLGCSDVLFRSRGKSGS